MTRFYSFIFVLSLSALNVANAQWQALNGPPGANVRDMEKVSGGALYIVSNLQLFQTANNGDTWQQVTVESPANLGLEGITSDGAGNLYGVNYSRFYKSTDGGLNWDMLSTDGDFYGVYDLQFFGPDNYIAIYGWNGVYISTDQGSSWTKIFNKGPFDLKANAAGDIFITASNDANTEGQILRYPNPGTGGVWNSSNWQIVYSTTASYGYDLRLLLDGASRIYAAVSNDIILSSNNGTNWSSIKSNIVETYFYGVVWGLSPNGTVFFTNVGASPSKIYSTANQGGAWTSITSPTDAYGSQPTRISFSSATTIFLGSDGDGVFRSDNGGAAWTMKNSGLKLGNGRNVEVANNGRILYLNNYRQKGYWTSTDNGANWVFVGIADYAQSLLKLSDGKILLYSGGPVYQSADNGGAFTKIADNFVNVMVEDAGGNLFGGDYNVIYKSIDKGDNWTDLSLSVTGLPSQYYSYNIAVDNTNALLFVWVYDYGDGKQKIFKIPVAGGAASVITNEPWMDDGNGYINNMFLSNNKLYVAEYNSFYESADQGTTWKTIAFSGERVFPIDGGLCVSRNGALYVTQDGGKSWNSSSLPNNRSVVWDMVPITGGFLAAATNSPALKFTGQLIVPVDQLPPYIDFNWQPIDGPFGGEVRKVFSDGAQNSYALSFGRLFKTFTFSTWQIPSTLEYVNDVIIDKPNNTIYALHYNSLSKSTNGGASWSTVNSENISCRQTLIRCTNGVIAMGTTCGAPSIYVSADGGVTFGSAKLTLTNSSYYKLLTSSVSSAIFVNTYDYSSQVRKLMRSTNSGASWSEVTIPDPNFDQITADNNGNLYMWQGSGSTIYKSSDDGNTWANFTGNLSGGYIDFRAEAFTSPSGAFLLIGYNYAQQKRGFWKTTNNGVNWTFIPTDLLLFHSLALVGTRIVGGTQEGLFTSDDEAVTFTERSHGISVSNISDLELINPSQMIGLTHETGSYVTTNFNTWQKKDLDADRFLENPDGSLIAYNYSNVHKSSDNGLTWARLGSSVSGIGHLATANGSLYFNAYYNTIKYTNDFITWSDLNVTGLPDNFYLESIAVNPSGFVFVILYNYSSNAYELYQILFGAAVKFNQATNPRSLTYSYSDQKIILFDGNGLIFETTDGSSWITRSAPSGNSLIIAEKGYYFIQQYGGTLWLSRNQGQTWQSVGLGSYTGDTYFQDVVINEFDGYAYAALYNRVVHKSANIVIPAETVAPVLQALNPVNNATAVPATTKLSLTFNEAVKTIAGKKIRILDDANPLSPVEVIDISAGVQNGKTFTFTPATALIYEKIYFVIVESGAFTDIFGNPFGGITTSSGWRFTIQVEPDAIKPTINYTLANPAFINGGVNKIQITVTDEGGSGVNAGSVKLRYRGIMAEGVPAEALMSNPSGNTFEVTIQNSWLDELGLEFIIEARDNQGNIRYSPEDGVTNDDYHKGYIAFPETANLTLPSGVVGSGGAKENYRIFSIPHKLTNASINTQFSEIISGTPGTDYRILNYNTDTEAYSEYPGLSTITRGSGYWINTKNSATIAIENASTPENSKEQLFSFTLKPGWNQIGNPYPFTISWNAVKGSNTNIGVLKSFNGSGWADDDKLNPFEGGFVLFNGTANITVPVPFSAKTTLGRTNDDVELDFEGGWWLPLRIENSRIHSLGGVGMHPEAVHSFDQFDDAMPPKVFDMPEISFPHTEHFVKNFTRDVVPPQDEYTWNFTVHSGEDAAVLNWDINAVKLLANEMYLFDEQEQTLIDMSEENSCAIPPQKSGAFKIYYGISREKIKPSKIVLGKPYPNPFTQQSNVSFTLPENKSGAYNVSLNVYDMLGRKVATLVQGEYSSGFYTGVWRPEPGEVNSSLYFYRLTVSDKTSNIVLTEKIITQK